MLGEAGEGEGREGAREGTRDRERKTLDGVDEDTEMRIKETESLGDGVSVAGKEGDVEAVRCSLDQVCLSKQRLITH